MKNIRFNHIKTIAIALFAIVITLTSCNKKDELIPLNTDLTNSEIPAEIKTYIATHFPENAINKAFKETDDGVISYKINLSGNIELEFNSAYQIIEIDASTQLPNSVIPQSILDYVSEHYPDNYITDWELENNHQQIELDNGLELEFGLDGVFIRIDSDGDDDDTDEVVLTDAEIPAEIKTYVSTYFPSNTIVKAVKETDDSVITYDIDLSGDIDLEFNSSFQIIGIDADTQLPDAVVPQAILTYVSRNYPNNFIISWELEAGFQYVELNNDIELKFDLNGVFISTDGGDDDPDEVVLTDAEIPAEIKTYVSTYFPSNTIVKAVKETDDNVITYDIDLSGDIDLEFNSSFQIIGIDADTQLPDAVVPQAILTYVSQNYPNNFIISWELEAGFQYVELNNDIELKFDLNGVFISTDGGDDDPDEVVLTDAEIPAEIKTYVSSYFPSNTIVKAVKETDDSVITYDIDLSGDIDLEFNSSFQIIGIDADTQLPDAVVPQAILTYVSQNYPNNFIISWELEAGFQYVELNNDIELKFDLNGVFISVDND